MLREYISGIVCVWHGCGCEYGCEYWLLGFANVRNTWKLCIFWGDNTNTWQRKIVSIAPEEPKQQAISDSVHFRWTRHGISKYIAKCNERTRHQQTIQSTWSSFKFFRKVFASAATTKAVPTFTKTTIASCAQTHTESENIYDLCTPSRKKCQMPSINLFIDTFGHRLLDSMIFSVPFPHYLCGESTETNEKNWTSASARTRKINTNVRYKT